MTYGRKARGRVLSSGLKAEGREGCDHQELIAGLSVDLSCLEASPAGEVRKSRGGLRAKCRFGGPLIASVRVFTGVGNECGL